MGKIEAIDAISDEEKKNDMIDIITNYQNTIDQLDQSSNAEATTSTKASENATQVSDVPNEIQGADPNLPDAAGNTKITDEESKKAPPVEDIISPENIDKILEDPDLYQDSDGDGLTDNIDATGDESQIEQAYDKDAEKASQESIRSFISLLAMLSNLDLTNMDKFLLSGDSQSLAVQATAGCAQVAIMHSFSLQDKTTLPMANRDDIKKMLNKFQNQSDQLKVKNLHTFVTLARSLPKLEDAQKLLQENPSFKKLPPEKQNALLAKFANNLGRISEMATRFK